MCVCVYSVVFDSLWPPKTVAHQAPLPMGFPRQEYWSGLPFPSPGDLSDPGIEPAISCSSHNGRRILYHWATREAMQVYEQWKFKSTNESLWEEGNRLCDHDILSVILDISEQSIQEMTDVKILSIVMNCISTWWNPLIGSYPYYLHEKPTFSLFKGSCHGNIWKNPSFTTSTEINSRT